DPSWGEEDFDRLEEFIDRMKIPSTSFTVLTPLPGTELYTQRKHEITVQDYGYYDVMHAVLPTRLPRERSYERFARLYDRSVVKDTRPSWEMVRRAVALAFEGNLWCMRRVYGAVKDVRDPAAYLRPPVSIRAPRRKSGGPPRVRLQVPA